MGAQGYLKAVEKEQIIEWMRAQSNLRLSDLQKYINAQNKLFLHTHIKIYSST